MTASNGAAAIFEFTDQGFPSVRVDDLEKIHEYMIYIK